ATIPALAAFGRPAVAILGGVSKAVDFTALGDALVASARAAILMGQAADEIAASIGAARPRAPSDRPRGARGGRRSTALARGVRPRVLARPGEVVLLSHACATGAGREAGVDEFTSYEERGDRFRELVREFAEPPGVPAR